ncbi:MAG: hypothetical protein KAR35_00860 [Candidatus Heimdallarchaeota archaeon]|nr:hypothetical protein [Candidatus Heimdallarchaeota archaeon]MCK5047903.1 hypothetical protein [Candidatus Heimdallarchaeota archaeon]
MIFFQKKPLIFLLIGKNKELINKLKSDLEVASENTFWDSELLSQSFDDERMEERLKSFDAFVYLIDAKDLDEIKHHRQKLWEKIIWNPSTSGRPIVLFLANFSTGLLTKEELIESLSLIRVTDRLWDVIEGSSEDDNSQGIESVIDQLKSYVEIVGLSPEMEQREAYINKRLEIEP